MVREFLFPLADNYLEHAKRLLICESAEIYNIKCDLFNRYLTETLLRNATEKDQFFDDDASNEHRSWLALLIAAEQGEI